MKVNSLQTVLEQWPQWPVSERPTVIKEFTVGLNHQTVLLKTGVDQLVLKLFREPETSTLATHTIAVQQWAHLLGLAPEILFSSSQDRYMLMQFLPSDGYDVMPIAAALRHLHAQPPTSIELVNNKFDYSFYLNTYLKSTDDGITDSLLSYEHLVEHYLQDPTPIVSCHNDLVVDNCFVANQAAKFIDWDFAQANNPWFDLASVLSYHQLDSKLGRTFLETYRHGWGDQTEAPIYFSAQCAVLVLDIAWHQYKFGSQVDDRMDQKLAKLGTLKNGFEAAIH